MIIVVGSPRVGPETLRPGRRATGLATGIALAGREAGARVEVVGKIGDDPEGDGLVVELEREGVGHAALLRDPAAPTPRAGARAWIRLSPADVELALKYLADARVIVAAEASDPGVMAAIEEAARYAGAHLIVIGDSQGAGSDVPDAAASSDPTTTRLRAPTRDEGPLAAVVGRYAAALDRGEDPASAFQKAIDGVGWEPARG